MLSHSIHAIKSSLIIKIKFTLSLTPVFSLVTQNSIGIGFPRFQVYVSELGNDNNGLNRSRRSLSSTSSSGCRAVLLLSSPLPSTAQGNSHTFLLMEKLSFLCPWCSLFTCSAVVWSCESCLFHLSFFFFFTFAFWLDDMCLGGAVWVIYNSISVLNFVDRRRKVVPLVSSSLFPSLFYWNTLSFALLSHLSADFLLFTNCLCNYYANSLVHLLAVSFVCV